MMSDAYDMQVCFSAELLIEVSMVTPDGIDFFVPVSCVTAVQSRNTSIAVCIVIWFKVVDVSDCC